MLAFVALTVHLGLWQRARAEEKSARQAEKPLRITGMVPSAEPLLYRHVTAAGEWLAAKQIFVDNQVHAGRAGFHVVTPLRLAGREEVLLVNRGWIARDAGYPRAPEVPVPAGTVDVSGVASLPPARYVELSTQTVNGNVWQNLSISRFAEHSGLAVLPVVVLADQAAPGLAVLRERPDAGVAKHVEYQYTWFALAATAVALWIALNLRKVR